MFNLDFTDSDQTTSPVASCVYLMTLPDSEVLYAKSHSIKAEDGKVNTALPATKLKKQTNDTVFPGTAQNMVTNIKEKGPSKRREPIVVFIGHPDSEETSEIELPDLPKFVSSPFFGLNPEICLPHEQENDKKFWINFGLIRPWSMLLKNTLVYLDKKTVPENHRIQLQPWIVGKRNLYCTGNVCNWESNDTDRDRNNPYFWIKETHISVPWTMKMVAFQISFTQETI